MARRRRAVRKITIVVEARGLSDGSDVSMSWRGKSIERIAKDGGDDWNWISGAPHQVIAAIGLSRHGRHVTITSDP